MNGGASGFSDRARMTGSTGPSSRANRSMNPSVRPTRKSYTWNERGSISATASRPLGFEPALTVPDTAGRSRLQYRFVSVEEVRRGDLGNGSYRILMLPHTIALSPIEAKKIKDFVE